MPIYFFPPQLTMINTAYHLFPTWMQIIVSQEYLSKYANKSARQSGKHLASKEI